MPKVHLGEGEGGPWRPPRLVGVAQTHSSFNASRYRKPADTRQKSACGMVLDAHDGMLEAAAQRHTSASDRESPNAVPDTPLSLARDDAGQQALHYIRAMKNARAGTSTCSGCLPPVFFFETLADCHAQYIRYQDEAVVAYQEVVRHQFYEEISRGVGHGSPTLGIPTSNGWNSSSPARH